MKRNDCVLTIIFGWVRKQSMWEGYDWYILYFNEQSRYYENFITNQFVFYQISPLLVKNEIGKIRGFFPLTISHLFFFFFWINISHLIYKPNLRKSSLSSFLIISDQMTPSKQTVRPWSKPDLEISFIVITIPSLNPKANFWTTNPWAKP